MRSVRGQDGFVSTVAVMVMTLVGMLAGLAMLASQQTSGSANDDRRSKRALAAAEAGLQQAAYRLTTVRPSPTLCLSGTAPSYQAAPVAGECAAVTGTSAGGDTFSYRGTPRLAVGATCANAAPVVLDLLTTDHCITSSGTASGVTRRLQARIRVTRTSIFNHLGLLGLDYMRMLNGDKIWADVGSNGLVSGLNAVEIYRTVKIAPAAPNPIINGSSPPVVRQTAPWSLDQVDYSASQASNNNAALAGWGPTRYSAAARTVTLNSGTFTMPTGTYNLCDFYVDNSVTIVPQNSASRIKLYIDSPSRPGSNCAAGTGRFCLDNSVVFNKDPSAADQALRFEIFVYGSTAQCASGRPGLPFDGTNVTGLPATAPVVLNNSVEFHGTIYSPTTRVILTNSVKMWGGVAAFQTDLGNSIEFVHPDPVRDTVPPPAGVRRLGWTECKPQPTVATDPESGCV